MGRGAREGVCAFHVPPGHCRLCRGVRVANSQKEALGAISGAQLQSPALWDPSKIYCVLHWKEGSRVGDAGRIESMGPRGTEACHHLAGSQSASAWFPGSPGLSVCEGCWAWGGAGRGAGGVF